jgi:hypothetical protein
MDVETMTAPRGPRPSLVIRDEYHRRPTVSGTTTKGTTMQGIDARTPEPAAAPAPMFEVTESSEHPELRTASRTLRFAHLAPPAREEDIALTQIREARQRLDDIAVTRQALREWIDLLDSAEHDVRTRLQSAADHGAPDAKTPGF